VSDPNTPPPSGSPSGPVPVLDLAPWYAGDPDGRARLAARVDAALSSAGFLLVTGHGVPRELREAVRTAGRAFFALPAEVKQAYAVGVMGRGWLPPGAEANGYAEGTPTPPDLKESFSAGADTPTGDPAVDAYWFRPNVWPAEVPALHTAVTAYLTQMRRLADDLLGLCALALGRAEDFFTSVGDHPTNTFNINWYPSIDVVGEPLPGQYRIGPHTDFGTVTILDREPGAGGLQIWHAATGAWIEAPYHPDAFTINTGDLLAYWSGQRWTSNRHRVLPPSPHAPAESLVSLVYFHETNHDTVVQALKPPVGRRDDLPPVVAADFLRRRLDAIAVG
jgi:isopenicillin N synthase-like dioxygenase